MDFRHPALICLQDREHALISGLGVQARQVISSLFLAERANRLV